MTYHEQEGRTNRFDRLEYRIKRFFERTLPRFLFQAVVRLRRNPDALSAFERDTQDTRPLRRGQ